MTRTAPSRELLLHLGQDLRWPAISLGRRIIAGEPGWLNALCGAPPLAPSERRQVLGRLSRYLLVANAHARSRLRRWLDLRPRHATPIPTWLRRRWIAEHVSFYGDRSMLTPVVTALLIVPEPVCEAALAEVAFLGVGAESKAWISSSRFVDRDGEARPRVIVLSAGPADELVPTVIHELGHLWASPPPHEHSQAITAQGEGRLLALAASDGWLARAEEHIARGERFADACAAAWSN